MKILRNMILFLNSLIWRIFYGKKTNIEIYIFSYEIIPSRTPYVFRYFVNRWYRDGLISELRANINKPFCNSIKNAAEEKFTKYFWIISFRFPFTIRYFYRFLMIAKKPKKILRHNSELKIVGTMNFLKLSFILSEFHENRN